MRPALPFFWRPKDAVSSLAALASSGKTLKTSDVTAFVGGENFGSHPLLVAELAGGKIIGNLRLAATADDVVIGGLQTVFGSDNLDEHYALRRLRFRLPKYRRGTALLLGTANSDNYYHWLLESLPRWRLLQLAGYTEYDFVLLHGQPCPFQDEILDLLGVPWKKRLRCSKNFIHQFERLVIPAMPAPPWQVETWTCNWIRSLLPSGGGLEKIYLSRHNARRRRLVNEAEIEERLKESGFAIIQPEQLSVAEQAKLLGSAKWVVAPHGAALTNLVFAPPGALLVELFHPDIRTPCYKNLATACGLRYVGFIGRRTRELSRHNDDPAEFEINVADVLQILAENACSI